MKPFTICMLSLGTGLLACTPSIEDYPSELEEAFCAWQHACHQYARPGDCVEANGLESDPEYTYLMAAVSKGNVEYDREAAAACLDAVRERSCTFEDEAKSVCDGVFRGRIGRNGPCLSTAECAGNAVCGFDPNDTDMCPVGACRVFAEPVKTGEPCSFGGIGGVGCEADAFCASDPVTFLPTVCTARVKAGGDCSLGQPCVETAACDGSACQEIELRGPGEECSGQFVACEEPGVCRGFEDLEPPTCVVAAELGAPCDFDIPCARFDTFCDETAKLCTLLPGPGQGCFQSSCLPYAECESSGVDGDSTGSRCVARLGAGESCAEDGSGVGCLGGLWCIAGTCALPVVEVGDVCQVPDAG